MTFTDEMYPLETYADSVIGEEGVLHLKRYFRI